MYRAYSKANVLHSFVKNPLLLFVERIGPPAYERAVEALREPGRTLAKIAIGNIRQRQQAIRFTVNLCAKIINREFYLTELLFNKPTGFLFCCRIGMSMKPADDLLFSRNTCRILVASKSGVLVQQFCNFIHFLISFKPPPKGR